MHILSALAAVLEARPSNPCAYLSRYFCNQLAPAPAAEQAYHCLCNTHPEAPGFLDSVAAAFCALVDDNAATGSGCRGAQVNELVGKLCAGLPDVHTQAVQSALKVCPSSHHKLESIDCVLCVRCWQWCAPLHSRRAWNQVDLEAHVHAHVL